jgi:hypothetical protein
MTPSDLADYVQAKAETRMPLVAGAALKRLKKLRQNLCIDGGTAIAYLDPNVGRFAHNRDAHRLVRHSVVNCICDEIPQQLLHTSPVPGTLAVANNAQVQLAIGIGDAQLLQLLGADCS